ncbi:MAG: hypothetical protein QW299_09515 [Candidatus Caldarchaeum sp.]
MSQIYLPPLPHEHNEAVFPKDLHGIVFSYRIGEVCHVEKYAISSPMWCIWRQLSSQFSNSHTTTNMYIRFSNGAEWAGSVLRDVFIKSGDRVVLVFCEKGETRILYGVYNIVTQIFFPVVSPYRINKVFFKKENPLGVFLLVMSVVLPPILAAPYFQKLYNHIQAGTLSEFSWRQLLPFLLFGVTAFAGWVLQFLRKPEGFDHFFSELEEWVKGEVPQSL